MSSLDNLIADRDEWEDRARAAEAELAELQAMLRRLAHEVDRLRVRCAQFEGTETLVAVFGELGAVLRSMQTPAPADELATVTPLAARRICSHQARTVGGDR
jgi:hypothetical protein